MDMVQGGAEGNLSLNPAISAKSFLSDKMWHEVVTPSFGSFTAGMEEL